jgi:regulator of protease activity HflC (stomatin/prohibitin superfamily)
MSQGETLMLQEIELKPLPGALMLAVVIAVPALLIAAFPYAIAEQNGYLIAACVLVFMADLVCIGGFNVTSPNEAKVVQLLGAYRGTIKHAGFWWVNPFSRLRRVSLRVRNFESSKLKVNDQDGNPIEIASVIVWRVIETAEAVFHVDDYEQYVHVQSESAVRTLATAYPYDAHLDGQMSLRMSVVEIAHRLRDEIQERVGKAGVEVVDARITHLAYAPEIAGVMLRRQQANAIIAARQKIVEGAVGMVEMALDMLSAKNVVTLDEERKASMVSNLLVVLCSDRDAQPIVNAGTLYQ